MLAISCFFLLFVSLFAPPQFASGESVPVYVEVETSIFESRGQAVIGAHTMHKELSDQALSNHATINQFYASFRCIRDFLFSFDADLCYFVHFEIGWAMPEKYSDHFLCHQQALSKSPSNIF
jgi:hypothetical protein